MGLWAMPREPEKTSLSLLRSTDHVSHNNQGQMGYQTPNIDRVAKEGVAFTDWYGQQSCTAGRAAFITARTRSVPD